MVKKRERHTAAYKLRCALERSKAAKRIAVPPRRSRCSGRALHTEMHYKYYLFSVLLFA